MTDTMRLAVAAAAVIALTLGGGLLPLLREWNRQAIRALLAFGTGVLLGAAFFHMIPEAVDGLGRGVGVPVLAGFLLIYVLERFVMLHACEEEGCSFHHMGLAAFLGITLHSLIDGFALGAGLTIPTLTAAVTAAIVLHKLPASLSLTGILLHCEYPRKRIVWMIVLFSLSTPVGAVLSFWVLKELTGGALHYAIAFSAGTFLAIATADLLPQIHSAPEGRYRNLFALAVGILLMSDLFQGLIAGGGHAGHVH
ncbi:MAG TPA: ZIP family metal transporter [bacterium]|nr:ZIP family metal transporter [bacterium]